MSDDSPPPPEPSRYGDLVGLEHYWRDHQVWLEECGYMLRPRFRSDWVASWKRDPTKSPLIADDGWPLRYDQVIDAIRIEDNAMVALKVIKKSEHPDELDVMNLLGSEPLASDPQNHCIPLLEALHPPDDGDRVILVMRLMRSFDQPRFDTFGEAVEFFRQMFEGLQFMHRHGVAHRDCTGRNIMMDGQHLFPDGFHPRFQVLSPDRRRRAKHYTRTQRPVKYYLIDFGISTAFKPGEAHIATQILGRDRTVPEFIRIEDLPDTPASALLHDPFPVDVYYIGNTIRREFLIGIPELQIKPKLGFEFMWPLISDMVQADPLQRPTMDEVVSRFEKIRKNLSSWKLRSRVAIKEDKAYQPLLIIRHWYRRVRYLLLRIPSVPTPKS
ncbi:kinase-like domain-containing protein [Mycena filopes]|nr:kinase-like domain-containing protein [Mycena filopes]